MKGCIYLIPVTLGNPDLSLTIPVGVLNRTLSLRLFAVEDIRSARRFLRSADPSFPVDQTTFFEIGKHSDGSWVEPFFAMINKGIDGGVMSEAGMPGLADPGNMVTMEAHRRGLIVTPLTGPSSIMLAMVASGLNGQSFAFHGYLPVDQAGRQKRLKELERLSESGQTQIFMETPFRNEKLFRDVLASCKPGTKLCIAADITCPAEEIRTMSVGDWKKTKVALDKRPAIFLISAR